MACSDYTHTMQTTILVSLTTKVACKLTHNISEGWYYCSQAAAADIVVALRCCRGICGFTSQFAKLLLPASLSHIVATEESLTNAAVHSAATAYVVVANVADRRIPMCLVIVIVAISASSFFSPRVYISRSHAVYAAYTATASHEAGCQKALGSHGRRQSAPMASRSLYSSLLGLSAMLSFVGTR